MSNGAGVGTSGDPLSRVAVDYRLLLERLPFVVYADALDDVSSALYMSPQVEALLGYSVEESLADRELFVKLLHPGDRERVLEEIAHSNETGELFRSEYRLVARDGRVVWFEDRAVAVAGEEGKAEYALGYMVDISDRKRAEDERRMLLEELEREAHAAAVLSHVADGVFQVDARGRIRLWNRAAERVTGILAEETFGRRVEQVLAGWSEVVDGIDVAPAPGAASRREAVPLTVRGTSAGSRSPAWTSARERCTRFATSARSGRSRRPGATSSRPRPTSSGRRSRASTARRRRSCTSPSTTSAVRGCSG